MNHTEQLKATALAMMAEGKGILAADESSATAAKRFAEVAMENTEENRRHLAFCLRFFLSVSFSVHFFIRSGNSAQHCRAESDV